MPPKAAKAKPKAEGTGGKKKRKSAESSAAPAAAAAVGEPAKSEPSWEDLYRAACKTLDKLREEVLQHREDKKKHGIAVDRARGVASEAGLSLAKRLLGRASHHYRKMLEGYSPQAILFLSHEELMAAAVATGISPYGITRTGQGAPTIASMVCSVLAQMLEEWLPQCATLEVREALDAARRHSPETAINGIVSLIQAQAATLSLDGELKFDDKVANLISGKFWLMPCTWIGNLGDTTRLKLVLVVAQSEAGGYVCGRLREATSLWAGVPDAILLAFCVNRRRSTKTPETV